MKTKIFFVAAILVQFSVAAQTKSKLKFTSVEQVGWIDGQSINSYLVQTINGVSYKDFSAGLGIGIDNYYMKTVPVFLDVRKSFGKKKLQPFAYMDGGLNFPWAKRDALYDGVYDTGIYFDAGAGYSLRIKKLATVLLSVGYTAKTMTEDAQQFSPLYILPTPYTGESNKEFYAYRLNRLTVKLGVRF